MVKCLIFHKNELLSGFKLTPPVLQSVNHKESGNFTKRSTGIGTILAENHHYLTE